jgi:hypothetical protein
MFEIRAGAAHPFGPHYRHISRTYVLAGPVPIVNRAAS